MVDYVIQKNLFFQIMLRRSDLAFRQEMKFRNRLVDYLTDWVLRSEEEVQNMAKEVLAISW